MKTIDLTGKIFEKLTVLKQSDTKKNGKLSWDCLCECGNIVIINTAHLKVIKSCGCYKKETGRNKNDLLDQRYGSILVIAPAENIGTYSAWLCRCDCGNEKIIKSTYLIEGKSTTCGCKINRFPNNDPKLSSAMKIYNNKYKDGDLTFEQFLELSQQKCFYCGIDPSTATNRLDNVRVNTRRGRENQFSGEKGTFIYNGLDRIDSNIGHILTNVVPCCKDCNRAKLALSIEDFRQLITRIYNHWIK